jgi:general secretion pathway protein K
MRRRGFVLLVVLFFLVLMISTVGTFLRRSTLDGAIVRNRDLAARAEALGRGGVRIAIALLQQDVLDEQSDRALPGETRFDLWADALDQLELPTDDGGTLRLHVEDSASRINLNGLLKTSGDAVDDRTLGYLAMLLEKAIEDIPARPEEKRYDPQELAANLVDYVDEDDVTSSGEPEETWYQQQDPPYHTSADHVLLSVDELALVRGFDRRLVEALRPYVTVYPLFGGAAVNPNTAPTWVLAALASGAIDLQRLSENDVKRLVKARLEHPICKDQVGECWSLDNALGEQFTTFPELTGLQSQVFRIEARARYGDVTRTVEAVVDRSDPGKPLTLAWRVR